MRYRKKANLMNEVIIHLILIGLIFGLFFMATAEKINGRGVKLQVLEKQTALLIDSAEPGMSFTINKLHINGVVESVAVDGNLVKISVDGLSSLGGYPYFSQYTVRVIEKEDSFTVEVYDG